MNKRKQHLLLDPATASCFCGRSRGLNITTDIAAVTCLPCLYAALLDAAKAYRDVTFCLCDIERRIDEVRGGPQR